MKANILDGRAMARSLREHLTKKVSAIKDKYGIVPQLAVIQVGEDEGLTVYIGSQKRLAERIGIGHRIYKLKVSAAEEEVIELIKRLNKDRKTNGIILERPLPSHMDWKKISSFMVPLKNVEIKPPTVLAVMELIDAAKRDLKGKEAVIIGRSDVVGRPLTMYLLDRRVTVTICHTATKDLSFHTKRADILVAAAGRPALVKRSMVKKGAIVIDVGINEVKGKIVGDVDFKGVEKKAGFISPVPGGVGPVTVVMLMKNVVDAFSTQREREKN